MNARLGDLLLFAQRNAFRDMGSSFRDKREHFDPTDLIFWVGALVGVFVTLAILARVIARREQRQVYNSPRALFRSLCAAHNLDRLDRAVLRKLARYHGLVQPARLFVEPARFDAAKLDAKFGPLHHRIQSLGERLFAVSTSDTRPATASAAATEMRQAIAAVHSAAEAAAVVGAAPATTPAAVVPGKQPAMVMVPQMPSSFAIDAVPTR